MISTLRLWNDIGYTESGLERPKVNWTPSTSTQVFTATGIQPAKDKLFSQLSIKADYVSLMNCSYLRADYTFNNSNSITVYGWIDNVSMGSDTQAYPSTVIDWHIDYWMTYKANASFKAGTVKRRPSTTDIPPQAYPYRYRTQGTVTTLIEQDNGPAGSPMWWFYVVITGEYDGGETTGIDVLCFPGTNDDVHLYLGTSANHQDSPGLIYGIDGFFDECLGLMPSRIAGCYMSPIPPVTVTGSGTSSSPYSLSGSGWIFKKHTTSTNHDFGYFECQNAILRDDPWQQYTTHLPSTRKTTDTETWMVTDMDLNPVATMPWGIELYNYSYRMIVSASGAYIEIRFGYEKSTVEGTCIRIPCIPISNVQNSWSEYMYSGQREYDIQMRNLGGRQELTSGLMNTIGSTASTAGLGMMFGGVKGSNILKGAGATAGGNIVSSGLNYIVNNFRSPGNPNDEWSGFYAQQQQWEDYAQAKQTDSVALPGAGWDTVLFGRNISLVSVVNDTYSTTQRNNDISMYGAHVTEPMSSCQSLINTGGPLQIVNMTVGGSIPVEAKEYMKTMFANGVRLV